jgi:hypothetical protein
MWISDGIKCGTLWMAGCGKRVLWLGINGNIVHHGEEEETPSRMGKLT